jgi:sulfite exporter TauE/SafE
MMLLFGLGTLPAMLATCLGGQRLQGFLSQRGLKLIIAILLIASGAWTLYGTAAHARHASHSPEHSVPHH